MPSLTLTPFCLVLHELLGRGFLTVEYLGKREQLAASTKSRQISPRYTEVVVKQLDPRWARNGVTAALLKAAGYSVDVAVKTEFAGDLPAHLSFFFLFFFLGYRIVVHSFQAKEPSGHQTNLRYAGTTA